MAEATKNAQVSPPRPPPEKQKQVEAFKDAVREEISRHHARGQPVPVSRNGKLVWVGPGGQIVNQPE